MKVSPRFVVLSALFVTCLITANVIAVKIVTLGPFTFPAAIFIFPFSYIFGDVLTEVYGYRRARQVIWLGFLCNLVFVLFAWIGQKLPSASFWTDQSAYVAILGQTPRLLAASFIGYLVGEFVNSLVLSRMKVVTRGRWLWTRTIGSTVVGQALDTSIFITVAFVGTTSFHPEMILYHWAAKVAIEAAATPLTYLVVNSFKKREQVDTYDQAVNFNPFSLQSE